MNDDIPAPVLRSEASECVTLGGCQVVRPVQFVPHVLAFTTCRGSAGSDDPYAGFNLAFHVGDKRSSVIRNRQTLAQLCGDYAPKGWLEQMHGCQVVNADEMTDGCIADALWSEQPNSPCVVLTADCLPIVLAARNRPLVAVLHAGWRGLAADIIGETLSTLPVGPGELQAWLGPAIGPDAFEIGPEVRATFMNAWGDGVAPCFTPGQGDRYHGDLWQLATWRLAELGVPRIQGGGWCTYSAPQQFYSYRRDGVTGRMATVAMARSF